MEKIYNTSLLFFLQLIFAKEWIILLHFDWDLFKYNGDTNSQLLVQLREIVDETYQSIQNINAVKNEWGGIK